MLIVTSHSTSDPAGLHAASGWGGPCVFVPLPGHGLRARQLRELEERVMVFEWISPPASGTEVVSTVALRLGHLLRDGGWPLLYAASPVAAQEVAELWDLGRDQGSVVRTRLEPHGLERLLLGTRLIGHPLAQDFFRFLRDHGTADPLFVPLIEGSLVRRLH